MARTDTVQTSPGTSTGADRWFVDRADAIHRGVVPVTGPAKPTQGTRRAEWMDQPDHMVGEEMMEYPSASWRPTERPLQYNIARQQRGASLR